MGMPNIPPDISTKINIDHKGLINLLLISIALEEISLSKIIDSEAKLMQLYIEKLKCQPHIKYEEIIKINRSVIDILRLVLEKEKTLKDKLIQVIHFNDDYINNY